jgi:hypothetical protein
MVTRWLERSLLFGLGLLTVTRERVVQFVDKLVEEGGGPRGGGPQSGGATGRPGGGRSGRPCGR